MEICPKCLDSGLIPWSEKEDIVESSEYIPDLFVECDKCFNTDNE